MRSTASVLLALLCAAAPTAAQSQYQSTFQFGIGYTRPAVEQFDMASVLIQADDFFIETGLGIRTNSGFGDTIVSWLVRGALRPFVVGSATGHLGLEFSLHTNATADSDGSATLIGLAFPVGVAHPITDHFNLAVHVFPLAFEFGGFDTVTKVGVAEISAHILF